MSCVAIVYCESYDQVLVDAAVEEACLLGGMPDVTGKSILLKPNILSDAKEDRCITTHSQVVRSVVRLLKGKGAKRILIGDSQDCKNPLSSPRQAVFIAYAWKRVSTGLILPSNRL